MGITGFSYNLLKKHGALKADLSMLELGDQNLYFEPRYLEFAKPHFEHLGIKHVSVDLGTQVGGAIEADLSKSIAHLGLGEFDVITNFGTSEHVGVSLYHCFKNVHEHCKVNGLMIHENPKTGNWPGHGAHYMTKDFYTGLAERCGYSILELDEHPAMGNITDGWNVYCVLKRNTYDAFISEEDFNKLDFRKS